MEKSRLNRYIIYVVLFLSFVSVAWVINKKNGLIFDDYSSIKQAIFTDYPGLFTLLPEAKYNDRPVRLIVVKVLHQIFGLQTSGYYLIFVLIHLLNVLLAFIVAKKLFLLLGSQQSILLAAISSGIFGILPTSHLAVAWISATADLFCLTFLLLSIFSFLKYLESENYRIFYGIVCIGFYVIGLRTKEMILPLPIIIGVLEQTIRISKGLKFRISWPISVMIIWMVVYAFILFRMESNITIPGSPYYQSFSIKDMGINLIKYFALYFDPLNGDFTFKTFSPSTYIGVFIFLIFVIASMISSVASKNKVLLGAMLMLIGSLVTVLPMVNMQHRLYLYVPSFFMGLTIGSFFFVFIRERSATHLNSLLVLILFISHLYVYAPGVRQLQNYWLSVAENDRKMLTQILVMNTPEPNTTFYITGADKSYNIFTYGPGNVLNVLFLDPTLKSILVEEFPKNTDTPAILIKVQDNMIDFVP